MTSLPIDDYDHAPFNSACADLARAESWLAPLCTLASVAPATHRVAQARLDQGLYHINRAITGLWEFGVDTVVVGHEDHPQVGPVPVVEITTKDHEAIEAAQALETLARDLRSAWCQSKPGEALPVSLVMVLSSSLTQLYGSRIAAELHVDQLARKQQLH